jgi:DNA-directed RNA polymerase subunit delta
VSTPKGENLRVIELRTPDVMYLIKVNAESRGEIDEFLDQDTDTSDRTEDDDIEGGDDLEDSDDEEEEEDKDDADDGDDDDENPIGQ